MIYLIVAVTVAILATALNLLLTFGVIRKLRVHEAALANGRNALDPDATLPTGSTVAPVSAVTVDGKPASSVRADGTQLVGFFSIGCGACEERIPEFVGYLERTGVAGLAVVVTDADDSEKYVSRLAGHVDVVVEAERGPLGTAFGVTSYPALCLLDSGGVILANGNDFQQLPEFLPA